MLSATQIELCSDIVCQYNYYVVYYRYDYTEYTVGMDRDYLIELYCSDQKPAFENGVYSFTECSYYRVTENKYVSCTFQEVGSFSPVSSDDIVYSNAVEGAPQFCYELSTLKNYDFQRDGVYAAVILLASVLFIRLLFGGGK